MLKTPWIRHLEEEVKRLLWSKDSSSSFSFGWRAILHWSRSWLEKGQQTFFQCPPQPCNAANQKRWRIFVQNPASFLLRLSCLPCLPKSIILSLSPCLYSIYHICMRIYFITKLHEFLFLSLSVCLPASYVCSFSLDYFAFWAAGRGDGCVRVAAWSNNSLVSSPIPCYRLLGRVLLQWPHRLASGWYVWQNLFAGTNPADTPSLHPPAPFPPWHTSNEMKPVLHIRWLARAGPLFQLEGKNCIKSSNR